MPFSSPSQVSGLPEALRCTAPFGGAGEICRSYPSIGDPSFAGGVQFTVREPSPNTRVGGAGCAGCVSGRATADSGDGSDVPMAFMAVTVNTYSTLLVRPVSVHVVAGHSWLKPLLLVTV